MEEIIFTPINRVTKGNLGSLLCCTSLLVDEANCNKNKPQVARALPVVMMNKRAVVQRIAELQTRWHHQRTACNGSNSWRTYYCLRPTHISIPIPSHPKCELPGQHWTSCQPSAVLGNCLHERILDKELMDCVCEILLNRLASQLSATNSEASGQ